MEIQILSSEKAVIAANANEGTTPTICRDAPLVDHDAVDYVLPLCVRGTQVLRFSAFFLNSLLPTIIAETNKQTACLFLLLMPIAPFFHMVCRDTSLPRAGEKFVGPPHRKLVSMQRCAMHNN